MKKVLQNTFLVLVSLLGVISLGVKESLAGPIYVYTMPDGSTRFSNKKPPAGVRARVFTAKNAKFSYYTGGRARGNGKLFTSKFSNLISAASKKYELEESLVRAVIHVESAFNPKAVSVKGAQGLMQLMPANQSVLGVKDPFKPEQNINAGTRLLSQLLKRFRGSERLALAAYNAGVNAVQKYGGIPPYSETQNYVSLVLRLKSRYRKALDG